MLHGSRDVSWTCSKFVQDYDEAMYYASLFNFRLSKRNRQVWRTYLTDELPQEVSIPRVNTHKGIFLELFLK